MISVCMIARDSAADLARSLPSVAGLTDDLVVVDTGSRDDTIEVAKAHGARIFEFAWCDDFSAARNHALEQAKGDWVLWLDSDEAFKPGQGDLLTDLVKNPRGVIYQLIREDHAGGADGGTTEMWQERLFRNDHRLRFTGRCHPHFGPEAGVLADELGIPVRTPSNLRLEHWGYEPDRKRAKLERAKRLLAMELQDRPGQLYYVVELLRTQLLLGAPEVTANLNEAIRLAGPKLSADNSSDPAMALLLEVLMQLPSNRLPSGISHEQLLETSRKWFPHAPPLCWVRARKAFEREDYQTAERELQGIIAMREREFFDRSIGFDRKIIGPDLDLNHAACLIKTGRLDRARITLNRLVEDPGVGEAARANLQTINALDSEA